MSDHDFERRVERLFAQPPRLPDSEAFARRVEARLERGWGVRRLLVGAAGALGGVIAASQLLSTELVRRAEGLALPAAELPRFAWSDRLLAGASDGSVLTGAVMNGEVLWLTAAMLGLAAAFAATRWAEGV